MGVLGLKKNLDSVQRSDGGLGTASCYTWTKTEKFFMLLQQNDWSCILFILSESGNETTFINSIKRKRSEAQVPLQVEQDTALCWCLLAVARDYGMACDLSAAASLRWYNGRSIWNYPRHSWINYLFLYLGWGWQWNKPVLDIMPPLNYKRIFNCCGVIQVSLSCEQSETSATCVSVIRETNTETLKHR